MKSMDTNKQITIDAKGRSIGRVSSEAASILRGKFNTDFERQVLPRVKVRIINAKSSRLNPGKFRSKKYTRYTGYPGGFKKETPEDVITKKGYTELFRRAVYGMLPTNKLRARLIKNLEVIE